MAKISFVVNGIPRSVDVEPDMPLLWVIRDSLGLTGTKFGCGVGVCGACTVHRDGRAVRSCQVAAAEARGQAFTTIEGLSSNDSHPCQRAWLEEDVAQCGFCQPGMIMVAAALLAERPTPNDADIAAEMSDHVCRCGTYVRIRKAIRRAASLMRRAHANTP